MATTGRILIAEPSAPLREALVSLLGPALDVAIDAADALPDEAATAGYDLVLADWGLVEPGLAAWRECVTQSGAPALVVLGAADAPMRARLSARGTQRIEAIDKPVRIAALAERLRDLLRARRNEAGPRLGRFRFDPVAKLLVPDPPAEPVRLTEKEAGILDHLIRHGGVAERDALLRAVWGVEPGVTTHTLETHVYRLRHKIEPNPSEPRILVTENGGYRLVPSAPDAEAEPA